MTHLFDSHCHLDDSAFDHDRDLVIASLPECGLEYILWCGTNLATSSTALEYALRYDFIYSACGFYPHETTAMDAAAMRQLQSMLENEKCAAVGEIGLDYHYDDVAPEPQRKALALQLELAKKTGKPVILHEREALSDMLGILKEHKISNGVIHCFSGSRETAREYIDMGLHISFTGLLTFKSARLAPEAAAFAPRDRVLIETDSPYMTPVPFRGERNTSARVALTAARLAELWNVPPQEAADITCNNACRLFGIKNTQY